LSLQEEDLNSIEFSDEDISYSTERESHLEEYQKKYKEKIKNYGVR
jgi:hypothetical protein